VGSV
jgi:hypothetical protein